MHPSTKLTPADLDEVVRLYREGERVPDIATRFGMYPGSIYARLRKLGVTRSQAEANRRRMQSLSPDERARLASAAHDAVRGTRRTPEELHKRALTRQRRRVQISPEEQVLADWMTARGEAVVQQKAIGPYNIDIAVHPVAVEVFGGAWHAHGEHAARLHPRTRYLFDRGWHVAIVWVHVAHHALTLTAADQLVAWAKELRADPPACGQYRVIWGTGQFISAGSAEDEELTLVPSGRRGDYRRVLN